MAERGEKIPTTVAMTNDLEGPMQKNEMMILPKHISHGSEVLSAEAEVSFSGFDPALSRNAFPDTACRRTLIGSYTLRQLEQHLLKQGKIIIKRNEKNEFRFGNNGALISKEVAINPACVNRRRILFRASILPDSGCLTPLLLSKEFLRHLGAEINMNHDVVVFRALGTEIKLSETQRGHYAIPMFDFFMCFETDQTDGKCKNERIFHITALELGEQNGPEERTVLAVPHNEQDGGCRSVEMMENVKSTHPKMGMTMQELDAVPDHPSDALRCQMHGDTIIKEGKYATRGEAKSVAKQCESDKGYMEWIRNHINSKSGMEMQRLRIYIYQRDAQKKEQLMRERARDMEAHRPAWMETGSFHNMTMLSGSLSSDWSHVSLAETKGHRRRGTRRTQEQQKEILENWENMVKNLCQNYLEPDDDARQFDASQDSCTVHDEHDHVLACDQNFPCNAADVPDIHVRNHGRQTKEKSDGGALKKNTRRELERNVHDISVCCNHEEAGTQVPSSMIFLSFKSNTIRWM